MALARSRGFPCRFPDILPSGFSGAIAEAAPHPSLLRPPRDAFWSSFAVRRKGQRIGRNPKTGQEVPISPRRVLVFRASHALKNQINLALAPSGKKA